MVERGSDDRITDHADLRCLTGRLRAGDMRMLAEVHVTAVERVRADGRHGFGNDERRQTGAVIERLFADRRQALGKDDFRQHGATGERADIDVAARHGDGGQTARDIVGAVVTDRIVILGNGGRAFAEGRAEDIAEYGFIARGIGSKSDERDRHFRKADTARKRIRANERHAIGNGDLGKTRTAAERVAVDLTHALGNHKFGEHGTSVKRAVTDLRHARSEDDLTQHGAVFERTDGDLSAHDGDLGKTGGNVVVAAVLVDLRHAIHIAAEDITESVKGAARIESGDRDLGNARTAVEHRIVHARHAFGNQNGGQTRVSECMRTEDGHAIGNDNGGQSRAIIECAFADRRQALGKVDLGQHRAVIERAVVHVAARHGDLREIGGNIVIATVGAIITAIHNVEFGILLGLRCAFVRISSEDITENGCAVRVDRGIIRNVNGHTDERNRHFGKSAAACKRGFADGGHAVGHNDGGEPRTTVERVRTDGGHALGNGDRGDIASVIEGVRTDGIGAFVYGIGENDLGRASLIADEDIAFLVGIEDEAVFRFNEFAFLVVYFLCVVSNVAVGITAHGQVERGVVDDLDEVHTLVERAEVNARHAVGNLNAHQRGTSSKRLGADIRDTVGNLDAYESGAVIERGARDRGNSVGENDRFQARTAVEDVTAHARHAVRNDDLLKGRTIGECVTVNGNESSVQRHACKRGTVIECIVADRPYTARDLDRGQRGTAVECVAVDGKQSASERYARKRGTAGERIGRNAHHAVRDRDLGNSAVSECTVANACDVRAHRHVRKS